MLKFFQILTSAGLLGLTWLVFSADSAGKADRLDRNAPPSERILTGQSADFMGGSQNKNREDRAEIRSLAQLRNELASLQEKTRWQEPDRSGLLSGVAAEFVENLQPEEIALLLRDLFDPAHPLDGRDFWLNQLSLQIGKVAPDAGLALVEELRAADDEGGRSYLEAYLFFGWASVNPQEAWAGFQTFKDTQSRKIFLIDQMRGQILGKLAKVEPEMVLEMIKSSKMVKGDGETLPETIISWENRNLIFSNLPDGMNWEEIAEATQESVFIPGQPADLIMIQGPGPELFARWADENPADAIAWFTEDHTPFENGFPDNDWNHMFEAWYRRSPEKSIAFVESKIASEQKEKYSWVLRKLLDSQVVEEKAVRAARLLPDQSERFSLLKLAAQGEDFVKPNTSEAFVKSWNPMSQDVKFVMKVIPDFELSDRQVTEIKEIIRKRQGLSK